LFGSSELLNETLFNSLSHVREALVAIIAVPVALEPKPMED
jgi:hypothetical protein